MRPFLTNKLNQSFPDFDAKNTEEFTYRAMVASVYKKVIAELLQWIDNKVEEAKFYEKKEKGEIEDMPNIGGEI